jgi:hypothetical protein
MRYRRSGEPRSGHGLLKGFVIGFSLLPSLIGLLVIWHVMIATKRFEDGTEMTNRVARATYFWFAISRPAEGTALYPWLKYNLKEFLTQDKKEKPKMAPESEPVPAAVPKPDHS